MAIKDYRTELTNKIVKEMEEAVKENKSWDLPWKRKFNFKKGVLIYRFIIETGIKFNSGNSATYLSSWIKALKEDKNEIFKAAKDAGKAVDYIMERTLKLEEKIEGKLDIFDKLEDAHAKTEEEFKDFLNNKNLKQYTWHGNSLEDDKLYVKYLDDNKEIKVKDFRYWHEASDFLEKENAKISSSDLQLQKDAFSQDLENRLNKSKKLER